MLKITVPEMEYFDEVNNIIFTKPAETLELEHSLVALQQWESRWEKPFLSDVPKTMEESTDYIRCMTLNKVDDSVYQRLTYENREEINHYIDAKMTATTFSDSGNGSKKKSVTTAEIIYYWMLAFNIPSEYRYWHLQQLLTLIQVCNIKNNPPKKMGRRELMNRNRALNEARKQKMHTKG